MHERSKNVGGNVGREKPAFDRTLFLISKKELAGGEGERRNPVCAVMILP
jgi:hypothetical protein